MNNEAIKIQCVENEEQLSIVLDFCYNILGSHLKDVENYRYEDWIKRLKNGKELLLFACEEGKDVSAVLGRREGDESLILGFVVCDEEYRRKGITKGLINQIEDKAKKIGFKYITLGADNKATEFYEKCGYKEVNELHGQKIYQKLLK